MENDEKKKPQKPTMRLKDRSLRETKIRSSVGEVKPGGSFGRYKIIEKIGSGGMGKVYKAYDPQLDRPVALKVLIAGDVTRFIREAKAAAKLRHKNIVTVYDIGIEEGQYYFTMDLVEGVSLKTFLKNSLPSISQTVDIMIKVGEAIQYAHDQKIVHRDLNPSNIMLDKNNEPKVMDFGLAKTVNERNKLSKTGMILGTLQYMPPEQAAGRIHAIDERSDVYALGAVLYEMLTGRPPFTGGSTFYIISQIQNTEPPPPSELKRRIPKDIESICLKALEKNKRMRYQTAEMFVNDLCLFANGETIEARRPGFFRQFSKKVKRYKTLILSLFIILLIINNIILYSFRLDQLQNIIRSKDAKEVAKPKDNTDKIKEEEESKEESILPFPVYEQRISDQRGIQPYLVSWDEVSDEKKNRERINNMIASPKKATLGLLREAIILSISFGAIVYDKGDHEGCYRFYSETAKALCNGFLVNGEATDKARECLLDIRTALNEMEHHKDVCEKAWILRYAFDRTRISWIAEVEYGMKLFDLGSWHVSKPVRKETEKSFTMLNKIIDELLDQTLEGSQVVRNDPYISQLYFYKGIFHSRQSRHNAIASYDKAVKFNTNNMTCYLYRGALYDQMGQNSEALSDYAKVIQLQPSFPETYGRRAYIYFRVGRYNEALSDMEHYQKFDPRNPKVEEFIKRCKEKLGQR